MKTKRITLLSDLHKLIGNYLYENGDANIVSIMTHNSGDINNKKKYSLVLRDVKADPYAAGIEEKFLTIDYRDVVEKEIYFVSKEMIEKNLLPIPNPPEAPPLRTLNERFFPVCYFCGRTIRHKEKYCSCCGKEVSL